MTVDTQCQKPAKQPPTSPSEAVPAAVKIITTPISQYILGEAVTFFKRGLEGRYVSVFARLHLEYEGKHVDYIVTGVIPRARTVRVTKQTVVTTTPALIELVKQYLGIAEETKSTRPSETPLAAKQVIITPTTEYFLVEAATLFKRGLEDRYVSLYDRIHLTYKGKHVNYVVTGVVPAASSVRVTPRTVFTVTLGIIGLVKQYLGIVEKKKVNRCPS